MKQVAAIRHVVFEDMDGFEPILKRAGYQIIYHDAPLGLDIARILNADLVVILGGPMGVYEADAYPFIKQEIEIARHRLEQGCPILGICLGSQIMAAALGARVYPGTAGVELGWSKLQLTAEGRKHPLAELVNEGTPVLHWHGDTFDLPAKATLLASSDHYPHQAFSYGTNGLALQCHTEVTAAGLERWYREYASYLEEVTINIATFRKEGERYAPQLASTVDHFLSTWLQKLNIRIEPSGRQ